MPPSHPPVIPNFLRQAVRGGTIVIHGDGNQTRDYVYVDDAVQAMMAASTAPSIDELIINVGSGTETSVRDLARLSSEYSNRSVEIIYNPRSDAGVSRMCADIKLAGEKLHYSPRVKLADGLRITLERDPLFQKRQVGDS